MTQAAGRQTEEQVECPACAGQGQVFPGVGADLWDGRLRWPDALQAETCELCQGSGEVDPKAAEEWAAAQDKGDR